MKKLLLFFLLMLPFYRVSAAEDAIRAIGVSVDLQTDGSAAITEMWIIENVFEGTEYFIEMNLPYPMTVHSLQVTDDSGQIFEPMDHWDIHKSFEEKAFRSGIIQNRSGYELVWGISGFGNRVFTIQYVIEGLVQGFEDVDGIIAHEFVRQGMSSPPQEAQVTLMKNGTVFTDENTIIDGWGFSGELGIAEGMIIGRSASALRSSERMVIRAAFAPGIFEPNIINEGLFDDFSGPQDLTALWYVLGGALLFIGICFSIYGYELSFVKLSDGTKAKKPKPQDLDVCLAPPLNGNIPAIYSALKLSNTPAGDPVGAYLMLWEVSGGIQVEKNNKNRLSMFFSNVWAEGIDGESVLYNQFRSLAGTDLVLNEKKLGRWEDGSEWLEQWKKNLYEEGLRELENQGLVEYSPSKKPRLNSEGFKVMEQIWSYQYYLKTYDDTRDSHNWSEDLVFAALFGLVQEMRRFSKAHGSQMLDSDTDLFMILWMTQRFNSTLPSSTESASSTFSGGSFSGGGGGGSR